MTADGESIRGCIADPTVWLSPVMDDAEVRLWTVRKKVIQPACDHNIQIQKQHGSAESRKLFGPQSQLSPATISFWRRNVNFGAIVAFHFTANVDSGISVADKAKRLLSIASDHRIQPIDIIGSIGSAPVHADELVHAAARDLMSSTPKISSNPLRIAG